MHLFSKENIWSNPHAVSSIQSSHPDKHNNSVDRIISKEEEREDPRRDSSIYLRVQNTVVFPQIIQELQDFQYSVFYKCFHTSIQQLQVILHTELILLQEFSKKYYNYKAHPVQITTRHLPATAPRASKHSTWQNPVIRLPTAFQGHTAQTGFQ